MPLLDLVIKYNIKTLPKLNADSTIDIIAFICAFIFNLRKLSCVACSLETPSLAGATVLKYNEIQSKTA